ncbi:unnamed protein product [Closterium sp. NIES-65]|nr:unnamed protein product [Closterium sp. NIES-65]
MGAGSYKAAHPPHPPLPPHTPRNDAWEQGAMRRRMLAGLKEVGQAGRAQGNIDLFRMQGAMRRQVLAVLKGGKQCILIPSPHDGAAVIHKCMVKGDGRGQTATARKFSVHPPHPSFHPLASPPSSHPHGTFPKALLTQPSSHPF